MAQPDFDQDWQKINFHNLSVHNSRTPSRHGSQHGRIEGAGERPPFGFLQEKNENVRPLDMTASWVCSVEDANLLSPVESSEVGDDNDLLRKRNKSITFDTDARLDNGDKHAMNTPLPRISSSKSVGTNIYRNASRHGPIDIDPDVSEYKVNPFTGTLIKRRPRRQDTQSSWASNGSYLNMAGRAIGDQDGNYATLTSRSTASAGRDEVNTPPASMLDSFMENSFDIAGSSPPQGYNPWTLSKTGSVRSAKTVPTRPQSARHDHTRPPRRSPSTTTFSPASAFLSKWGGDSATSAPEPDDEGQVIGKDNEYIIGRQIGFGGSCVVKEVFHAFNTGKQTKKAVKIIRKINSEQSEEENESCQQQVEHEIGIWKHISHRNILALHTVFETEFAMFCLMDMNEGGSLYDLIRDNRKNHTTSLPFDHIPSYSYQLASALRYLHEDIRLVHRDIKMENCLISFPSSMPSSMSARTSPIATLHTSTSSLPSATTSPFPADKNAGWLRLCDFGLAEFISTDSPDALVYDPMSPSQDMSSSRAEINDPLSPCHETNVVGTLEYAAPELLRTEKTVVSPTVDVWAFACCVYALIVGDRPFKHSLAAVLVENIGRGEWDRELVKKNLEAEEDPRNLELLMELLEGCFQLDMFDRWTIAKVLSSEIFAGFDDPYDE